MDQPVPFLQDIDPGFWTKTSWLQLGYGFWVSLTQLGIGLALGFQSEAMAQLLAPNSTIKITNEEIAWSASVMALSAPIGCLISGSVTDRLGRRAMLRVCQIPMCIGWFYMAAAKTAADIIYGRVVTGIACGMSMFPPRIYAAEISLPNMRGMVGSLCDVGIAFGIAVQAVLGTCVPWKIMCNVCGLYTLSLLVVNFYIPDTPYYVLLTNDVGSIKNNLAKFRSSDYNLDDEVDELLEFQMDNDIRRLRVVEKLSAIMRRATCEPFGLIAAYSVLGELAGVSIVLMWTIDILSYSRSSVDPRKGNIFLAITRLIVAVFTCILLFKVGRRRMAITSALGVSVVCFGLGSYLYFNINVVPEIWLIAYVVFASLGYYTLPLLMMAELYTLQIRGFMGGITCSLVDLVRFSAIKYYPDVKNSIGFANSIFLFGAFSLLGTLFLYFFLPETKSLTLQDIEEYYNARRPTLVSQRRVKLIQLNMSGKLVELSSSIIKRPRSNINSKSSEILKLSNKSNPEGEEEQSTSKGKKSKLQEKKPSEIAVDKANMDTVTEDNKLDLKEKKRPYVTISDYESTDSENSGENISSTKKDNKPPEKETK